MVVWQDVWLDGGSNVFCESNDRSNLSLLKFIISLTTRFYLIHFSPASVLPSWLIDSETYISSSTTTESTYHFFPFALICIPTLILLMLCFSNCFAVQSCIKVAEKPVQRMHLWVEPPSDGGKHCSSWWVSLSFKKIYPLAVSEAITTPPHMPHELIPPPKLWALVADQSSTVLLVSRWGQPADGKPGDGITKTMRRPCDDDTAASTNCWE